MIFRTFRTIICVQLSVILSSHAFITFSMSSNVVAKGPSRLTDRQHLNYAMTPSPFKPY
jgi:hypothetical protein